MMNKTPLLVGFEGTHLDAQWKAHLKALNPYGVILFRRNIQSLEQTAQLIKEIQDCLHGVVVAVDHEGGLVNRLGRLIAVPPSAFALGKTQNWALVREAAAMKARALASLGIRMNFDPCLDLYDPASKAIGFRAFSANPEEVAHYGRIHQEEFMKQGVVAVGKHFPGHGRIAADTHFEQGKLGLNRQDLEQDLYPFQDAIRHGMPALMTAHLHYPALDEKLPATLSEKINQQLLRQEMGFDGVLISDCLEMAALGKHFSANQMVELGRKAGLDLWLSSFSLMKSREFQLELAQALQQQKDPASAARLDNLAQIWRYEEAQVAAPDKAECLALHRVCLGRIREESIPAEVTSWNLVEVTEKRQSGVNAGEDWSGVARQLLVSSLPIHNKLILNHAEPSILANLAESGNKKGEGLLLVTSHAHRLEGFPAVLEALTKATWVIHISLGDERDLGTHAQVQWATYGSNDWTGPVLIRELQGLLKLENQCNPIEV